MRFEVRDSLERGACRIVVSTSDASIAFHALLSQDSPELYSMDCHSQTSQPFWCRVVPVEVHGDWVWSVRVWHHGNWHEQFVHLDCLPDGVAIANELAVMLHNSKYEQWATLMSDSLGRSFDAEREIENA